MGDEGTSGQGSGRPPTKLRRGPKPKAVLPRKPGRPKKALTEKARGKQAAPLPAAAAAAPAKAAAKKGPSGRPAKPRLGPQGARRPGRLIGHLAAPTAAERSVLKADAVALAAAMLPHGLRAGGLPAALAHHLRLLPQLDLDDELSLPLAYLMGLIGFDAFRSTDIAARQGWQAGTDRQKVYDSVRRFVVWTCNVRARSESSPTHRLVLPLSGPQRLLRVSRRPRGKAGWDALALADSAPRAHRRRAAGRVAALAALVDMWCGRVGGLSIMVTERTLTRFQRVADRFQRHAASKSRARITRAEAALRGGPGGWTGELANRRELVAQLGAAGAAGRTRSVAALAAAGARAAHERRVRLVEGLIRLWDEDRRGKRPRIRALHVRLGLAGTLHDATNADAPFTPADGARLIGQLAAAAVNGLRCAAYGVFDAHRSGNPHLHLILLIRRGDHAVFKRQLAAAYGLWGMEARGAHRRWVDRLVHVDELRDSGDGLWYYPVAKLQPAEASAAAMLEDRDKVTPQVRLAAWRHAHGIGATWSSRIENRAAADALGMAEDGAHPVLDQAREASSGGRDLPAALLQVSFAPGLRAPRMGQPRVVGSKPIVTEEEETVTKELSGHHPLAAEVARVPGSPTDRGAFAHIEVRLANDRRPYAITEVMRRPDGSPWLIAVERVAIRRRPTKGRALSILEASGSNVVVVVEPQGLSVPVASDMSPDEVNKEYQKIAAAKP